MSGRTVALTALALLILSLLAALLGFWVTASALFGVLAVLLVASFLMAPYE